MKESRPSGPEVELGAADTPKGRSIDPMAGTRAADEILLEWSKNPRAMWAWRTDTFRRTLLEAEKLALQLEKGVPPAVQLKALELLSKLSAHIDAVREDLPTICPKCKHTFTPGK